MAPQQQPERLESGFRAGFVALVGVTNAGKSTLMNRLIGKKISSVTHKVQTTRMPIRGICIHKKTQIIFVDMPGFFSAQRKIDQALLDHSWNQTKQADLVVMVIDAERGLFKTDNIFMQLNRIKSPKILVLNKIDCVRTEKLLALARTANEHVNFEKTFMVSALTGSGCDDLLCAFSKQLPEGAWLYEEDQISDLPLTKLCAEITREKLYLRLHKELPYQIHVETTRWEEKKDGSIRIEQEIKTEKPNHKKIVIGHQGKTIRDIGQTSRYAMQDFLEKKVHLFLFVKGVKSPNQTFTISE